tara:strand:+ start:20 stop:1675 length:1656 start_codon:yes stop_codon:yes gene_type:complete
MVAFISPLISPISIDQITPPVPQEPRFEVREVQTTQGPIRSVVRVSVDPETLQTVEEQVNLNLSPTGNPAEAYQIQKQNEANARARGVAVGAASIVPVARMGIGALSALGTKLGPRFSRLNPFMRTTSRGQAGEIIDTGIALKPGAITTAQYAAPTALIAGSFLLDKKPQDLPLDVIQANLDELKKSNNKETIEVVEPPADPEFGTTRINDAGRTEIYTNKGYVPLRKTEDGRVLIFQPTVEDGSNTGEGVYVPQINEIDDSDKDDGREGDQDNTGSPLFGTPRFMTFLRNVGAGLVAEGQPGGQGMGSGLAKGATAAAAEIAVQRATEQEQFADLLSKQIEAGKIKVSDRETVRKVDNLVKDNIFDYDNTYRSIQGIDQAIAAIENTGQPGSVAGLQGLFGQVLTQILTAVGANEGVEFDDLDPRTKGEAILKVLSQQNIKASLQEAGRAISNLDRQVAAEVFGEITTFTPLSVILKKLEDTKQRFENDQVKTRNALISNTSFLQDVGIDSATLKSNQQIIEAIITGTYGVDPDQVQDNTDAIDINLEDS